LTYGKASVENSGEFRGLLLAYRVFCILNYWQREKLFERLSIIFDKSWKQAKENCIIYARSYWERK